jgi:TRAP-type C4-dicarboxylate transport system permease large subunit
VQVESDSVVVQSHAQAEFALDHAMHVASTIVFIMCANAWNRMFEYDRSQSILLAALTDMPHAQASIGLVIFISFFLVAAVFEGNYGEDAVKDDSIY